MSKKLRERDRFLGPEMINFKPGSVLRADDLNYEFEGLRREAALRSAAPDAPGLFRPWWCDKKVNVITVTGPSQVSISSLFLMTDFGQLIYVQSAQVSLEKGPLIFLTTDGSVNAGEAVPDGAILLAKTVSHNTLKIEAKVATVDATQEIDAYRREVIEIACNWHEMLSEKHNEKIDNLASVFASVPKIDVKAKSALECFANAAKMLHSYLEASKPVPHKLEITLTGLKTTLVTPPEPRKLTGHIVEEWLRTWSNVLGNKDLLSHVFAKFGNWLEPVTLPSTTLGTIAEYRFDLSSVGKTELELDSNGPLENLRWRFGEDTKEFRVICKPYPAENEHWRARLPPKTADTLVVSAKNHVRVRAISNPGIDHNGNI